MNILADCTHVFGAPTVTSEELEQSALDAACGGYAMQPTAYGIPSTGYATPSTGYAPPGIATGGMGTDPYGGLLTSDCLQIMLLAAEMGMPGLMNPSLAQVPSVAPVQSYAPVSSVAPVQSYGPVSSLSQLPPAMLQALCGWI